MYLLEFHTIANKCEQWTIVYKGERFPHIYMYHTAALGFIKKLKACSFIDMKM